jgi:microcompartment protein CcmL/EutN
MDSLVPDTPVPDTPVPDTPVPDTPVPDTPSEIEALGILETTGYTPAMVALDTLEKAALVRVIQLELNDFLGMCIKFTGQPDAVQAALDAGLGIAEKLGGRPVGRMIPRVDQQAWTAIESAAESSAVMQQVVVHFPTFEYSSPATNKAHPMNRPDALGFIETQGFTAVFAAIDAACKAANVEVVGKEKLGGGYITVVIQGDVAAVHTAVDVATTQVEGLGKLIAAHVVTRPSEAVLGLLPK